MKEVIEIIANGEYNERDMFIALASNFPETFLKIHQILNEDQEERTDEQIMLSFLREGERVAGVKDYRERTGKGLYEAKQFMDSVRDKFGY